MTAPTTIPNWPDFTVDNLAWAQAKEMLGETAELSLLVRLASDLKDAMKGKVKK